MHTKQIFLIVVLIGILILGGLFFRLQSRDTDSTPAPEGGLGSDIYSEVESNEGSVPSVNPTANPIEGAYKNPFE